MKPNFKRRCENRLCWMSLGLAALAMSPLAASTVNALQADEPDGGRSLLQTLAIWKYPGSTMLGGASMSDGGNPLVQSVKCKAILTTPDAIDKVIAYYSERLEAPAEPGTRPDVARSDAKSVSTQNDSQDRPVTLRVFVVNKADTSTTLVISRAEGEKDTHIAWLHYIRLSGK
jgi:hypothetical protein